MRQTHVKICGSENAGRKHTSNMWERSGSPVNPSTIMITLAIWKVFMTWACLQLSVPLHRNKSGDKLAWLAWFSFQKDFNDQSVPQCNIHSLTYTMGCKVRSGGFLLEPRTTLVFFNTATDNYLESGGWWEETIADQTKHKYNSTVQHGNSHLRNQRLEFNSQVMWSIYAGWNVGLLIFFFTYNYKKAAWNIKPS